MKRLMSIPASSAMRGAFGILCGKELVQLGRVSELKAGLALGPEGDESQARAVIMVPLAAVLQDGGRFARGDANRLARLCGTSAAFHLLGAARTGELIEAIHIRGEKQGSEPLLIEAGAVLRPDLAETAYLFAIRLCAAGIPRGDLADVRLMALGAKIGLSPPVCRALLEAARTLGPAI